MRGGREPKKLQRRGSSLKEEDRNQICEGFQEIERDLALEALKKLARQKLEDFVTALENLHLVIEVSGKMCD